MHDRSKVVQVHLAGLELQCVWVVIIMPIVTCIAMVTQLMAMIMAMVTVMIMAMVTQQGTERRGVYVKLLFDSYDDAQGGCWCWADVSIW